MCVRQGQREDVNMWECRVKHATSARSQGRWAVCRARGVWWQCQDSDMAEWDPMRDSHMQGARHSS